MRVQHHPILGDLEETQMVEIEVDGRKIKARNGEMIAAALLANDITINRYTQKKHEPRSIFCGIGKCTDCVMTVNGIPNVRTCVTPVSAGMVINTQHGVGKRGTDE
jgi:predicted molibdopterin-dependent oxidoreductase YjgC